MSNSTFVKSIFICNCCVVHCRSFLLLVDKKGKYWLITYSQVPNRQLYICIHSRVGKWSRVSRETRLKIGLAISRDLKCKTCKTQKLAKIMHLGRFREGNKAIPHLTSFLWQPKNYVGWKLCYVSHSITCPHSPTLKLPSCVANL